MLACPYCATHLPDSSPPDDSITLISCSKCREAFRLANGRSECVAEPAVPPQPLSARVSRGSVMEGVLEHLDESIEQLPTIPVATQRVFTAIHDPLTTSSDLAAIIHEDATLSMRVLRLANSALFAGREASTDLRLACARLGMRNIASVAHLVAHEHVYKSPNPVFRELMAQLWHHAVATARLTDSVGSAVGGLPRSSLFLSGLVHDVGKPVLLDVMTNRYRGRTGELKKSWNLLLNTLDEFSPYIGLRVVQHWRLAPEIRFTTFYANAPGAAPRAYRRHAYLVALASLAAESAGFGIAGDQHRHAGRLESVGEAFAAEVSRDAAQRMAEEAADRVVAFMDAVAAS